jgi:hypothetical protein
VSREPQIRRPAPAPVTTGPAFGDAPVSGLTPSAASPTLLRYLSGRPPEDRKAVIDSLNGQVGNRRVAGMIAADAPDGLGG